MTWRVTNIVIRKISLSLILKYLSFFSNVNHSVIVRIAAGLSVIMITGNDTKSSVFMTKELKIFTKCRPCQ